MLYILVLLTVYAVRLFPSLYSRPLLVYPAIALMIIFAKDTEKARFLLLFLLLFMVVTKALPDTVLFSGTSLEKADGVYGTVTSDTAQRKNRRTGFNLSLSAVTEGGNVHTGHGDVFVIAPQTDLLRGDKVFMEGSFRDGFFLAAGTELLSRARLSKLRNRILGKLRPRLSGEAGELGLRLLLGNGDDGGYVLSDMARKAGLSHVLALSGMHLAVLSAAAESILCPVLGKRRAGCASSFFLVFFTWLSGWKASLSRALFFRLLSRFMKTDEAFALSFALTVLVIPSYASSLALHYALLSLSGILLLSPPLAEELSRVTRMPLALASSLTASASALLLTVPLTSGLFGSYSLGAIASSVPASMLISIYMTLSLFSLVLPLGFILRPLECVVSWFFSVAALIPESVSLRPYLILCFVIAILLISKVAGRMLDSV